MIVSNFISLLGIMTLSATPEGAQDTVVLYVSPDGNDDWSGRLPQANNSRTDGPFATLQHARDAIRTLKDSQGDSLKRPINVFFRGGTYFLNEPIVFGPEDSGTEARPVTFSAYPDETPNISGGRRITGWKLVTVNGQRLWSAEIPPCPPLERGGGGIRFFHQLWVNGQRRAPARHPKTGYLKVAENPDATSETPWHEGQTRFQFHEGDLKAWESVTDAEVTVMSRWTESHLPIANVDETERTVTFGKRSVFRLEPGDFYYVENAFEFLEAPGEWYLNRQTGTLYYLPMPDEDMSRAEIIAPALAQVIRLEGKPEDGQFVEHLTFRGLTFAHTEWWFPEGFQAQWPKPDVGGFAQAAIGVPGSVTGEGVRRCTFDACTFAHLGAYALELGRGCQHNRVLGCEIAELGAGGVKIGETVIRENEAEQTHSNEISDCAIHDGGLIFHSAIGIWVGQSYNNRMVHNDIHDFYYSGFSVGWTWGYGNTLARGNVVEFNHVHHIGVKSNGDGPILSDMGGIYTLGMQPGTVIRFNRFHDIAGFRYGGWGIYFDEGSTHIVAENNLVYRTTHGGFHQHYGRENVVRNNIFAFGRDQQIQRSRPEPHLSFTFEGNIVYWREGKLLAGNLGEFHFAFDHNIYWREGGGDIQPGGLSWTEWQAKGMDKNSLITDPLFVAPEKEDFRLKPDAPVLKAGFVPFEFSEVGRR
ncbi:right-handed parallel beta-helix repeat-containing protein [Candidatus Poribacteria bacterium]|nr:right-handed parallel beta-helix repeat-containing protein [Candidatus Poribacteria bacterium]